VKKEQILKLIKKCTDLKIEVHFIPGAELGPYIAEVIAELIVKKNIEYEVFHMYICREFIYDKDTNWKRSIILHELGHMYGKEGETEGAEELKAQTWAMNKAKELGWPEVQERLKKELDSWSKFGWNENGGAFRRYRLAYKLKEQKKKLRKNKKKITNRVISGIIQPGMSLKSIRRI